MPASPPTPRLSKPVPYYALDSSRGLPTNQIHRLAMDRASRLWFATPVGLSRFDGSSVRSWDRRSGLQCNGLRSVDLGPDGTVWIGTDLGLEAMDASGRPLDASSLAWPFGLCQHIDASGPGAWVGAARGLAHVVREAGGRGLRLTYGADIGFVNDIERIDGRRVFAATAEHGLVETNGAEWWPCRCPDLPRNGVRRLFAASDRTLLVGTEEGLFVVDLTELRVIKRLRGPEGQASVSAVAAASDRYWTAFGRLLDRLLQHFAHLAGLEMSEA